MIGFWKMKENLKQLTILFIVFFAIALYFIYIICLNFSIFSTIGEECVCRDWHGCIMAQSIVGLENVQPYKFSECSKNDYIESLRGGQGLCLLNKPNEVSIVQYFLLYYILYFFYYSFLVYILFHFT